MANGVGDATIFAAFRENEIDETVLGDGVDRFAVRLAACRPRATRGFLAYHGEAELARSGSNVIIDQYIS